MATAVKNADKIHNMTDIVTATDKKWAKKYVQKVKKYYAGKFTQALDTAIAHAENVTEA